MGDFVSPRAGPIGRLQTASANAHGIRALLRRMPFVTLESDVRDIVYCNWVVPADRARAAIPATLRPGVEIVARDGMTILTILTYVHGHFGPALAGPMRRLFPSPLQSNWRLYVAAIGGRVPAEPTVFFLRNLFDSALYAVGTRLLSDALPSHLPATFDHRVADGRCVTAIDGGSGSAPGLHVRAERSDDGVLPADFRRFHDDWRDAVAALCLQDAAVAPFDAGRRLAGARIDLPIDPATVVPMTATAFEPGDWLRSIGAVGMPFCFGVPRVPFRVVSERIIDASADRRA